MLPFLAIYLTRSLDYSTAFAGLVLGGVGLGAVVASLVAGVLADRVGRRPVLLWSQVATTLTLTVMAYWTEAAAVLGLALLPGSTAWRRCGRLRVRPWSSCLRRSGSRCQMPEGRQVDGRLATRETPSPLLADR